MPSSDRRTMSDSNRSNRGNATVSLLATAVGAAVGYVAVDHIQARHENRPSLIDGVGRWIRENVLEAAHHSAHHNMPPYPPPRPLTRAEIGALPVRQLTHADLEADAQSNTRDVERRQQQPQEKAFCVVCRDPYAPGDSCMRLPCFHEFHADCITDFLASTNQPLCPICRHPISFS